MPDLGGYFDYSEFAEPLDYKNLPPIPADWYVLAMVDSKFDDTKKKDGSILNCTFDILEGEFKGRKIFCGYNWLNKSAEAQRIGREQFMAVARALGVKLSRSEEAHGRPLRAYVGIEPEKTVDGKLYKARNILTHSYESVYGTASKAAPQTSAPAAATAPRAVTQTAPTATSTAAPAAAVQLSPTGKLTFAEKMAAARAAKAA